MLTLLLGVQVVTTLFLVGLIWTIQSVSYPLFASVPASGAAAYHAEHMRRITPLVAPPMFLEVFCAGLLLLVYPGFLPWLGALLLLIIWMSTVFLQMPSHGELAEKFDPKVAQRLVQSNWLRTIAWTMRGVVAVAMFFRL